MTQLSVTLNISEKPRDVRICVADVIKSLVILLLCNVINVNLKTKICPRTSLITYDMRDKALFHSLLGYFKCLGFTFVLQMLRVLLFCCCVLSVM